MQLFSKNAYKSRDFVKKLYEYRLSEWKSEK
jgi:hypothetical protein